jgi:hypothetical protein
MTETDIERATREETQQTISMMMLVLEGNAVRDISNDPYQMQLASKYYQDTSLVNTLIYSAERFEQLIREGRHTIEALKVLRHEGVMQRYEQSFTQSGQEIH